jgi:hypothetical protein
MPDKGVQPDLMQRRFFRYEERQEAAAALSEGVSQDEIDRRSDSVARVSATRSKAGAVAALDALRAARPLKPPGR